MHVNVGEFAVVQTGAAQPPFVELETEWLYKVQCRAGVGAKAYDIAGIGRNFRLMQNNIKHKQPLLLAS